MELIGPIGQCPTSQMDTTDGVVMRHAVLYIGNLLTVPLKSLGEWKIICSIVANGFFNESPPFFHRKFPNTAALANINQLPINRSPLVPVPEVGVFGKARECFRERF